MLAYSCAQPSRFDGTEIAFAFTCRSIPCNASKSGSLWIRLKSLCSEYISCTLYVERVDILSLVYQVLPRNFPLKKNDDLLYV